MRVMKVALLAMVLFGLCSPSVSANQKGSSKVWKEQMKRAQNAYTASDYDEALQHYRRALQEAEKIQNNNHNELSGTLRALGQYYLGLEQHREAVEVLKRAADLYEDAIGTSRLDHAINLAMLGEACFYSGDYILAETSLKRALEIVELQFGKFHPLSGFVLSSLAQVRMAQKRYEEADQLFAQAYELAGQTRYKRGPAAFGDAEIRVLPPIPKLKGSVLNGWGNLCVEQKRYTDAEQKFLEALKTYETGIGKEIAALQTPLRNLASLKLAQNDKASAEAYFFRELAIEGKAPGGLKWMASTLKMLLPLYCENRRGSDRGKLLAEAIEFQKKTKVDFITSLVDHLLREDIKTKALIPVEKMQREALVLLEAAFGTESKEVAPMLDKLSSTLANLGRTKEAEEYYTRSLVITARQ